MLEHEGKGLFITQEIHRTALTVVFQSVHDEKQCSFPPMMSPENYELPELH